MTPDGRRFDAADLESGDGSRPSVAELADSLGLARELESHAAYAAVTPSDDFVDRVMASVAVEPVPRPVVALASAVRSGRLGAMVTAFIDTWRVAIGGRGRPLAVRAQSMAVVFAILIAAGSVGVGGAIGVSSLLVADETPVPVAPSPTPSPSPTVVPVPTASVGPSASPGPTPSETPESSDTPRPTESAEPSGSAGPGPTASASDDGRSPTPKPSSTPHPSKTPSPSHDDETPDPEDTPDPSDTPEPTEHD